MVVGVVTAQLGQRFVEAPLHLLAIDDEARVRFNIAQIYASMGDWQKVEEELLAWFQYVERPNAVAYYLLAISRYRRDQYDDKARKYQVILDYKIFVRN